MNAERGMGLLGRNPAQGAPRGKDRTFCAVEADSHVCGEEGTGAHSTREAVLRSV